MLKGNKELWQTFRCNHCTSQTVSRQLRLHCFQCKVLIFFLLVRKCSFQYLTCVSYPSWQKEHTHTHKNETVGHHVLYARLFQWKLVIQYHTTSVYFIKMSKYNCKRQWFFWWKSINVRDVCGGLGFHKKRRHGVSRGKIDTWRFGFERVKIHLHSGVLHVSFGVYLARYYFHLFALEMPWALWNKAMKRAARSPSIPNSIANIEGISNFVATISILRRCTESCNLHCGRQLGSTWGLYLCVKMILLQLLRAFFFARSGFSPRSLGPEQASREDKETSVQKPCVTCLIHYVSFRYVWKFCFSVL